ncbi:MAG TPA: DUF6531 domain-containing protein [Verrucomicrobiae bacterium]|nr:DUF6531 domain-containing protein [Verrucomicrobiae bacterium]
MAPQIIGSIRFVFALAAAMFCASELSAQTNAARTGRFYRGTGTDTSHQSFVLPLDFQKGVALDNVGGNSTNLFPGIFWGLMRYHYDAENPASANDPSLRIPFDAPIVAFGGRVGGSPLYYDHDYHFGTYAGVPHSSYDTNTVGINIYRADDRQLVAAMRFPVPRTPTDTNAWRSFLTNGFQTNITAFGLSTTIRFDESFVLWGLNYPAGAFHITHRATKTATNYLYVVVGLGSNRGAWMATDTNGFGAWSRLYSLEFQERPPWHAVYLDQPHFSGSPVPSVYRGKSVEELLTNSPPVTNVVSLSPSVCTNLDASPELRLHPLLNQFVTDMRGDPIALANFVQNEISLCDAIAYKDNGAVSDISINCGGVNRGALATFMERQGSPTEQCALLVYLLRRAGVPAAYMFGADNGVKMTDAQLSALLRMQIRGAINSAEFGNLQPYTTNSIIPVNYPWVAAYIGTNWIHLFPWLKDTQVMEGLWLYDYMPSGYKTSYQWVRDYLRGRTNIMSLSAEDDTPEKLFPLFVQQMLDANAPGISMDDLGMKFANRRHLFSRWTDFPRPLVVTNISVAIESLGSSSITNVNPRLTNIFDSVSVKVTSAANSSKTLSSGPLRMVDLHNRQFVLRHEKITSTTHRMILCLEAFRTDATGIGNFSNDPNLLKAQSLTNANLTSSDDILNVEIVHNRHRSLPVGFVRPNHSVPYLGMSESITITNTRTIRKGDLSAICLNAGKVTPQMLRVHAEKLWNMERTLNINPSATNSLSPDIYHGALAYLFGMAFNERISRFDEVNQRLHKVQVGSQISSGLAGLRAKRTSGALPNGDIDLVQPSLDIFYKEVVILGNTTVRLDSGDDGMVPNDDYFHLWMANGSAQEHNAINKFFRQTDAVSTVKLLQIAQAKSATNGQPGILLLDKNNYIGEGNKNYPIGASTKLKDHIPSLWAKITNSFNYYTDTNYNFVQVYMTPGAVTNATKSFRGLAAFILEPAGGAAAIGEKNGGWGANLDDDSLALGNTPNISLGLDSENNFSVDLNPPSASDKTAAPDSYANYNAGEVADAAEANLLTLSQYQLLFASQTLDEMGMASLGAPNMDFGQAVRTIEDDGWFGTVMDAITQWGSPIADPVHAVTGEFYIKADDIGLPGSMPLKVSRNYSSHNLADNQFGYGWKLNYMPYLCVNATSNIIYAAEPDGAVIAYEKTATNVNVFLPSASLNPELNNNSNLGIGSVANRFQQRIVKATAGADTFYTLNTAMGEKRTFKVMSFIGGGISRTRPYLTKWEDSRGNFFTFEYGTDSTKPDFGENRRIQSSNGSFLGFEYDVYGHIVDSYTGDGRRISYDYDQHGDLVTVTLPDSAEIRYEYEHKTMTVTNGSVVTTNFYSTHLVLKEIKPDGRVLKNEYDAHRRVTNQWATVGPDLLLVRNATFVYSNNFNFTNSFTNTISGFTVVKDVFNNTNRYDYTNGLITKIADSLGQPIVQDWYEPTETAKPGYHPRSLESRTDERGLVTTFRYDANGNATNIIVTGDLTGSGAVVSATNTTVYNAQNLPVEVVDAVGNKVQTFYHSQYPLLPEYVVRLAGSTIIASNRFVYENVTNTALLGATLRTNIAFGLRKQQIRALGTTDAATNEWVNDGRGYTLQSISYTGTGDPAVTNTFGYNDRGELFETIDGDGRVTRFNHDPMGRPRYREVYENANSSPLSWEHSYYNENGELTWSDGPRFDPEDYVWRDYDGAGRLITEVRWRSEANDDGTGVRAATDLYAQSFREYDAFGNLTRTRDSSGAITTNTWDALGRLTRRVFHDADGSTILSSEGFAYEPGGQIRFHTNALGGVSETQYTSQGKPRFRRNANGSTNAWRYYVDGRIHREIQGNGAYVETVYDDAARKTSKVFYSAGNVALSTNVVIADRRGNAIQTIDAATNVFYTTFDGLDRIKTSVGPRIESLSLEGMDPAGTNYVTNVVQQISSYVYGASSKTLIVSNALGEKTVSVNDALSRPVSVEIFSSNGIAPVRVTRTAYARNHHGTTVTNGTGSSAIVNTAFTDNDGRTVLALGYPASNAREFTRTDYDLGGNPVSVARYAATNNALALFSVVSSQFDGLHRVTSRTEADGSVTEFGYDAAGNVISRAMPRNLTWSGSYNSAGQIESEQLSDGTAISRQKTYSYYPSGDAWAGLLKTAAEGNGVVRTNAYDDWLRVASVTTSGPLAEQKMSCAWLYDARGLLTEVSQFYTVPGTGAAVTIEHAFDPYSQMILQQVYVNGGALIPVWQAWNSAARRNQADGMNFKYRADGLMSGVNNSTFGYGDNGLMIGRTNGTRAVTVDQRDGMGRPLQRTTRASLLTALTETWSWTGDGMPANYVAARSDFTDTRRFGYEATTRRLLSETFNLGNGSAVTNSYTFDNTEANGLGVLTRTASTGAASNTWSAARDGFSRIATATNSAIHRTADGFVNGASRLRGFVNGQPVDVRYDPRSSSVWQADMALKPGMSNSLIVYADHPSGAFTTNRSTVFTVSAGATDREENQYDGSGNVTNRIWRKTDGTILKTQSLVWDGFGRLAKITERDANGNGFNFVSTFDGLGRQIQTTETMVTNYWALPASPAPLSVTYHYDPHVEFQIIGIRASQGAFSRQEWLAYGPDMSGSYGGAHGIGGLETITSPPFSIFVPIVNDAFGNVLGAVTNGIMRWNPSRANLYAPVEGYAPPRIQLNVPLFESLAWRTRPMNVANLIQLGVRPYDPIGKAFLAADPLGHESDKALFTAFRQNPAYYFDADGRFGKGVGSAGLDMAYGISGLINNSAGALAYALSSSFAPEWAYNTFGEQTANFGNTMAGIWNLANDASGAALYAVTSPFEPDWAYQNFGSSMGNLEQLGTGMSGGEGNSGSYRAGYTAGTLGSFLLGGEFGQAGRFGRGSALAFAETTAAKSGKTVGLTTYDMTFAPTGNRLLDSVGIENATISNLRIWIDPGLTGADRLNTIAHEGFHAAIAERYPNFAASSGRLPVIGAFPLYAEEVAAYAYGSFTAGQYGQTLLAPISAFGSMSFGQTATVLGTGSTVGGLWYYGNH